MSDDTIQITVDGKQLNARKGQMLIEVTDAAGIEVPRFCYHKKLSVAANCRMCLVEVEKAPKPLPACATPVMPDMVVKTQSSLARDAQKGTMEFLLINHPLDCPICDQGGICELQDVAMGYGGSVSQYTEAKRVVFDKYIGPLIATEMTRCIHCTRCVRFGEEIAGIRELGATGRGVSEVSGNVIDICPVGALTARPSRYTARAWELQQKPSVSVHDSVGSNLFVHLDGNTVNQVVPRGNESINEVWISDRDRFSYQGLRSEDRLKSPMVRIDGELTATDWPTALLAASKALQGSGDELGVLASASSSIEELYLAQKLGRALGSHHIDHRLGQSDFSVQDDAPVMPWLGMQLSDLETLDSALLIGSNIRKDQPIAALRLRKAAMSGGAISFLNPKYFPMHFDVTQSLDVRYDRMVAELASIAQAAGADLSGMDDLPGSNADERHERIAQSLKSGERSAVILGNIAVQHPSFAQLQFLANRLSRATGATLSMLPERANTAGAWLAGVLPHRTAGGKGTASNGLNALSMLEQPRERYLLLNAELEFDSANPKQAIAALAAAKSVVSLSAFLCDSLREHAHVILPIGAFTESFGTYVNATGQWQSAQGLAPPPGDARPAWKVFRVLAEKLSLDGFGFDSPEAITREVQGHCAQLELSNLVDMNKVAPYAGTLNGQLLRAGETPIYATDPLVRRSIPLQKSMDGQQAFASMAAAELDRLNLTEGDQVKLSQDGASVSLPSRRDNNVPEGCVWIPGGLPETSSLGDLYGPIEVSKA